MNNLAIHTAPAWGPRSNVIIRADLASYGLAGCFEQLWARKIDATVFEICCIPFFTYGIALGDQVECDSEYTIQKVIAKGGHRNLRVAIAKEEQLDSLHEILHAWVDNNGLTYEWYSPGYLAADLTPDAQDTISLQPLELFNARGDISMEVDE